MKLDRAHVENFGVLHDFNITFESGLNVLYEENGFGKSTLAAFIRVMFYGFDGDRKREGSERKKFLPWQGGTFGGTLSFTEQDRPYRIERYFGERRGTDIFRLYRTDTGLESSDFGKIPGEVLFGLDAESFERTIYIGQGSLQSEKGGATPAVQAQIGDLTAEAADMGNYDGAMKRIAKAAASLSPDRPSGSIRKLEAQLSSLSASASRLPQIESAAKREASSIEEGRASLQLLEKKRKKLTGELSASSRSLAVTALKAQYDSLVRHETDAKAQLTRCRAYFPGPVPNISETDRMIRLTGRIRVMQSSPSPVKAAHRPEAHVPALLSAVFLVLTAVLFLTGRRAAAVPFAVIFLAAIAVWILFIFRNRHSAHTQPLDSHQEELRRTCGEVDRFLESLKYRSFFGKDMYADTEVLSDSLLKIRDKCRELSLLNRTYAAAKKERQTFEKHHDLSSLQSDVARTPSPDSDPGRELDTLSERIQKQQLSLDESERRLEQLRLQIGECREAAGQADALKRQIAESREQYRILNLTEQYLKRARENFTSQYRTPLLNSFTRYYGMISGIFPEDFEINADLDISKRAEGALRGSSTQSVGIRDLIALCRRMAIIDAMYRGKQPFVIFDDPFVNFDDNKMEGAIRFLDEIAGDRQVIYLTCQSARLP